MNQITQTLRSGEVVVREVPMPVLSANMVLIRNHYSVISAGTEGSTVRTARKSLLGKANARPQQASQVVESLKRQGPVQTYRAVMNKLDAYSPLGYSSAGIVMDAGSDVDSLAVGDRVACAGVGYANHAEVVCVPKNLCVKLAADADLKKASYNTMGAIALQGIRQADLRLGESCAVIGLGLLGQLACLMLRASGVKSFGIDIDPFAVGEAREHSTDGAWLRSDPGVTDQIESATDGMGVDAVIITAGTSDLDPINFAGSICRKKGRVVIVGSVPVGFDRDPFWYRKELELRMSCSYGPGRYDLEYEEKGLSYPHAYVRWTENRNMQAFQELVQSGRIDVDYLTTREYSLSDAPQAYEMILRREEPYLGLVLNYDVERPLTTEKIFVGKVMPSAKINIAFIGAGSYAQSHLLPNLPGNDKELLRRGVFSNNGTTSRRVAERFHFEFCTQKLEDILLSPEINTVFVATRHNSHADYVVHSLKAGKHVFVEKPLCLHLDELLEIEEVIQQCPNQQLMVGFNRRFSPHAIELKAQLGSKKGPLSLIYRINAGSIPKENWIQDVDLGGGRIRGEVCHFIDFLTWMTDSRPVSVQAVALPNPHALNDTISIQLSFYDGSIGTISYFSNGSKHLPKEYVEVYAGGCTGIIHDFRKTEFFGSGNPSRKRTINQDKGQAMMVHSFLETIKKGGKPTIPSHDVFAVTRACFAALESLQTRQVVSLSSSSL